jgi:hypothetical protein
MSSNTDTGRECLKIADKLSSQLAVSKENRLFLVHIITQLISFAKVRFAGEKKQEQDSPDPDLDSGVQVIFVFIPLNLFFFHCIPYSVIFSSVDTNIGL